MLKKTLLLCSIFVVTSSTAFAAADQKSASTTLTAEQILSKNAAARGGAESWQKINTMTMTGLVDAGKGLQLPYTLDLKRGRKVHLELEFDGKTAIQVYDGQNGWKKRPFLGHDDVEPFTAEELQKSSLDADIDGPLMGHVAMGTKVELEGMEKLEDRNTYKLKLTTKAGIVRHVWLDAETFLEAKIDGTRRMDGRQKPVATFYRDYKNVDGLMVPFTFESYVDGVKTTEKIAIDKVVLNPKLDDARFSKIQ